MKWPWRHDPPDPAGMKAARAALSEARAREPRVSKVVKDAKALTLENHFGPAVEQALRVRRR